MSRIVSGTLLYRRDDVAPYPGTARVYACARPIGRTVLAARTDDAPSVPTRVDHFTVAGSVVGHAEAFRDGHSEVTSLAVESRSLRTGAVIRHVSEGAFNTPDEATVPGSALGQVRRLVLAASGDITLRIRGVPYLGPVPGPVVDQIRNADGTAVDTAAPGALSSLRFVGRTVTWRHDGTVRGAPVA